MKLVLPLILAPVLAFAQHTPSGIPKVKFTDNTLDNGLRVIISEDHYAPVYAIAVSYKVGSRDERKGRTGFAHLFEHMMFKGSENVGTGELDYLIYTSGGNLNGTTNTDRTLYFETLPKNQVDLGLFLEADRMRGLVITQENLENQRQAVKEERRLRVDNQPYGKADERIDELIYDNFAYHHSVIGSMADLDAASVDDVRQFFKTYYAPNNAVLALVGDLDTAQTLVKVKKYFGNIPRQTPPQPVDLTEPAKDSERREKISDPLARLARVDIGYRIPPVSEADGRALTVAASIIGGFGGNSRLYQTLVKDKELAVQVFCATDRRTGPNYMQISVTVRPGKKPEDVESLVSEEIAKLHSEPVTAREIERTRIGLKRAAVSRISVLTRAQALADNTALYNDPNRINTEIEAQLAVTAADIQKAVRKYLVAANRVVIDTEPPAGAVRSGRRPSAPQNE